MNPPDFSCCGGNDETPKEHCQDCYHSITRFVHIEMAARAVLERPTSMAARAKLKKLLDSKPGSKEPLSSNRSRFDRKIPV